MIHPGTGCSWGNDFPSGLRLPNCARRSLWLCDRARCGFRLPNGARCCLWLCDRARCGSLLSDRARRRPLWRRHTGRRSMRSRPLGSPARGRGSFFLVFVFVLLLLRENSLVGHSPSLVQRSARSAPNGRSQQTRADKADTRQIYFAGHRKPPLFRLAVAQLTFPR